ncbi:NAD(P)H-hydrate dehydratase [Lichenihabitans sp. Uapishka_5]|uniref:NAD(P)H-hydrate dehydratase n=1 Tax=Lichenihabitans sp. Uapishka_5 TaxID=3037302 RepID=UPI0029E81508|nr:NAD(P)H-hydrate dehydratase [Lichenihabitans sp. Uapishka_5]MDX7953235.1 NAD(P)H-hydrate dehydratase [Lichenihabitans sp. Uapishka_5]
MRASATILLDAVETRAAERRAIEAGVTGFSLMERAGAAAAELCQTFGGERTAAVLCGPGNNGGDGFVVAHHLVEAGWRVEVVALDRDATWQGDAAEACGRWAGPIESAQRFDPAAYGLVVDALFGAGLSRPIEGAAAELIERLNRARRPVLAIDIPSGVDATTGGVRGVAVMASQTVSFGTAKPGHYLYPGRRFRGGLTVADIGLAAPLGDTVLNTPSLWLDQFPWPDADGHKYKRGHAVVVSGDAWQTGAARLAARAALRVGAGLVTLASPEDALLVNASQLTAVMVRAAEGAAGLAALLADPRRNAVVLGPGLGVCVATREAVAVALVPQPERPADGRARACLLDADALTSFSGDAAGLRALIAKAPGPTVITPHDGEFARLFSAEPEIQAGSKLQRARAAARFLGCVVLLKGPDTVVADPEGRAAIADGGSAWLATAGSGDVLSGLIGGLMTQGMPAFEAALAGDHLHTMAARLFGPGLIAEDLPETLPRVLRDLHNQAGLDRI